MGNVVKYKARDGVEIELNFDTIKRLLVRGKPELVTKQEMIFYMGKCKSRGLNPFAEDCHLVKFDQNPAAIIVSIHYMRAQARRQRDCDGWQKGIIVIEKTGTVKRTHGLILPGEELVGAWFRAKPAGWDEPYEHEINLAGYIKTNKHGEVTKFWAAEKQPTMIMKVVESQGLTALWASEFGHLRVADEPVDAISPDDIIDLITDEPEPETVDLATGEVVEDKQPPPKDDLEPPKDEQTTADPGSSAPDSTGQPPPATTPTTGAHDFARLKTTGFTEMLPQFEADYPNWDPETQVLFKKKYHRITGLVYGRPKAMEPPPENTHKSLGELADEYRVKQLCQMVINSGNDWQTFVQYAHGMGKCIPASQSGTNKPLFKAGWVEIVLHNFEDMISTFKNYADPQST